MQSNSVKVLSSLLILVFVAACNPKSDNDGRETGRGDLHARAAEADFAHDYSDIPVDEAVRYGKLDNGLRYAILYNDTPSATAAVRMSFNMGSLAERDDQRGIAHFIEHMAFNGSTHIAEGELIPLLERYGLAFGADSNAYTSFDAVGYQLDLPRVDDEVIDTSLMIMRETASELNMDAEAIERERGVILSEERARNTPIQRFFKGYTRFLMPDTIVADRFPIGETEIIRTAPRDAFVDYYENYYTPERAFVVVVGEIDVDAIEAKIHEHFASWQQPENAPADPDIGTYAPLDTAQFEYFYDPDVFTIVTVDIPTEGQKELDTQVHARKDMLRYLGNAMLQRRLQSHINAGQSALVQVQIDRDNKYNLMTSTGLLAVTSPDRWREGLGEVEQEIRRAVEYGFTQAELDEQWANLLQGWRNAAAQAGTRPTPGLADQITDDWLNDEVFVHPQYVYERLSEEQVSLAEVQTFFQAMWKAGPPQVMLATPLEESEGANAVRDAWLSSNAQKVEPLSDNGPLEFAYTDFGSPGEVVADNHVEDLGFDSVTFANGVKLNIKTTDFEDNIVRVRVNFGAGVLTPQPVPAASRILGSVFTSGGLKKHSSDELQRILAGKAVNVDLGVATDTFFLQGVASPEDFDLQMQLMAAYLSEPGWRVEALSQFRAVADEVRRGQSAQAVQVAINTVARMLREGDTRWGFPTAEEVSNYSMDHGRAMIEPALMSAPIEITIVGDITRDQAVEAVRATFGALDARDETWPSYDENRVLNFPEPTAEPIVVPFNGQAYQGMVNAYWKTTDSMDAHTGRVLDMLRAVLDQKSVEVLREELGKTYSAIVSNTESQVFPDYGYFWIGVDVSVEDVEATYAAIDAMVEAVREGDVSEDDFLRARTPILEELEELREDNRYWLAGLNQAQMMPETLDRMRSLEADYSVITREEVIAAARQYLDPEAAYRVSILPQSVVSEGAQ